MSAAIDSYNPYVRGQGTASDAWGSHEADRLTGMDVFFAPVAEADLVPLFASFVGDKEDVKLLDIGAGSGTTNEELCGDHGISYYALDANPTILEARPTPEDHKILGRTEAMDLPTHSFDVTYSRAVTAWSSDPERAIGQQLRVTKVGGFAVFTEFDWSSVRPGADGGNAELIMGTKSLMMQALAAIGFHPEFGRDMGLIIDHAADKSGLFYDRKEVRYELPEGDYRELFLGAATSILIELNRAGGDAATTLAALLQTNIKRIERMQAVSFHLPALVTDIVRLVDPEKIAQD